MYRCRSERRRTRQRRSSLVMWAANPQDSFPQAHARARRGDFVGSATAARSCGTLGQTAAEGTVVHGMQASDQLNRWPSIDPIGQTEQS
jgi:hypothetical protein